MALDLRPNINIPPDAFKPTTDPWGSVLSGLVQGQEQGRANRSRQLIQGLLNDPALKDDTTIGPVLPFLAAQPDLLPQVLPAMIAARSRLASQKAAGSEKQTVYVNQEGDWSQTPKPGYTPVQVSGSQYAVGFKGQRQFREGINLQRGKEVGKAVAKMRVEGKEAARAKVYLKDLYDDYVELEPKYGGAFRGPASQMVSGATGGRGRGKIPFANPKVRSFTQKGDLGIANLKIVANLKERLSDQDMNKVLEMGKFSLKDDPVAAQDKYLFMDKILDAIIDQDDLTLEQILAPLGITLKQEYKMRKIMEDQMNAYDRDRAINTPGLPPPVEGGTPNPADFWED